MRELAAQAGIQPERLKNTIDNYNQALQAQRLEQLSPPRTSAPIAPSPIIKPPFYAVPLCAGITYTFGGVLTNEHGQVLAAERSPIAGLYAVGATTGGLEGGDGGGYVGGLAKALTYLEIGPS